MPRPSRSEPRSGLQPWARRRGESPQAHLAYLTYQKMGMDRTLARLAAEEGYEPKAIARWSMRWFWQDRICRHDSHVAHVEQVAADKVKSKYAARWEERRQRRLEEDYAVSQRLRDRAEEMLDHPITGSKVSADGTTTVVRPIRWNHGNLTTILALASELEKKAIDEALPHVADTEGGIHLDISIEAQIDKVWGPEGGEE